MNSFFSLFMTFDDRNEPQQNISSHSANQSLWDRGAFPGYSDCEVINNQSFRRQRWRSARGLRRATGALDLAGNRDGYCGRNSHRDFAVASPNHSRWSTLGSGIANWLLWVCAVLRLRPPW